MAEAHSLVVTAADGFPLSATLWLPETATPPTRVVIVNAGAGIPARYYDRFAAWLADRGLPTLTYDYRGIGRSAPAVSGASRRPSKCGEARIVPPCWTPWRRGFPARLAVLGHSIGGFCDRARAGGERVDQLALVGTHTGYWRDYGRACGCRCTSPGISRCRR
jgi:predicted alpha/beta hydrolase